MFIDLLDRLRPNFFVVRVLPVSWVAAKLRDFYRSAVRDVLFILEDFSDLTLNYVIESFVVG